MKRNQTKIKLARETVRSLSGQELDGARGGVNTFGNRCLVTVATLCGCQSVAPCFSDACYTVAC